MLTLLSPAKSLDFETAAPKLVCTQPRLLAQSQILVDIARKCTSNDLIQLMSVSENIAALNVVRFADWQQPFTTKNAKPALFAFTGDVYQGMQPSAWTTKDVKFAQENLRILSGLYGLLRPLDLMQAYRLEMGIALANPKGKNLYTFWKEQIVATLNEDLVVQKQKIIINLASDEYFKAVDLKKLDAEVYTTEFRDFKNGVYKIISFNAKKARGMMADFIVRNKIKNPKHLQAFDSNGYRYDVERSTARNFVFLKG